MCNSKNSKADANKHNESVVDSFDDATKAVELGAPGVAEAEDHVCVGVNVASAGEGAVIVDDYESVAE